jgi:hypothetical protein
MATHNHGPDEGPGLMCPETVIDGKLTGTCLIVSVPKTDDYVVDITRKGNKCGTARISPNGEIVNIELETGLLPSILASALTQGLITSISLAPHYNMTPKEN